MNADNADEVISQAALAGSEEIGVIPDKKHSLDSDEEDDAAKHKKKNVRKLTIEDIEGEEDETIRHEGEIKITPFNLKEEMASGYFDSGGFFVANGRRTGGEDGEEEVRDSWLDNIDSTKVDEKVSAAHWAKMKALAETDSDSDDDDFDLLAFRKIVLGYLEKKESVTKAIKRLSENVKKAKKAGDIELMEDEQHSCNKLMDYVNQFVDQGHYDIYQETYESLTAKVNPILTSATSDDRKRNPDDDDLSLPKAKQVKFDSSVNKDDLEDMFK